QSHKEIIAIGTHVAIHVAVPAMSSIDPEVSRTRASRVHPLEHPCHVGVRLMPIGEEPGGSVPRKSTAFCFWRRGEQHNGLPGTMSGKAVRVSVSAPFSRNGPWKGHPATVVTTPSGCGMTLLGTLPSRASSTSPRRSRWARIHGRASGSVADRAV